MSRGIILDRDGTLCRQTLDPKKIQLLPGVVKGLTTLRGAWEFAIATNQPGAAKRQCSLNDIYECNGLVAFLLMKEGIHICDTRTCIHASGCYCRKPLPFMLLGIMRRMKWTETIMVGDSECDVEAAKAAGIDSYRVGVDGDFAYICRLIKGRPKPPKAPKLSKST